MSAGVRTTVVWVPDWSVAAAMAQAGVSGHQPAVVHDGRRVVATSSTARAHGVRRGMGRRHAHSLCPETVMLADDPVRDVAAFEQVAVAVEAVVSGVEVVRPGLLILPAGGAARYHGSEEALAALLVDAVAQVGYECGVGTADGLLAAILAARTTETVPVGASVDFLVARPIGELQVAVVDDQQSAEVRALVDLLVRLGIRTVGSLAQIPASDVLARFGKVGSWARTMACGLDPRPPVRRRPEPDLEVSEAFDPPATRVDQASFAGRRLADQLSTMLVDRGLTGGRLQISIRTDGGDDLSRVWRTGPGGMTTARIVDRVRWQLEGWLSSGAQTDEAVGIGRLVIAALDVTAAGTHQEGLWGAPSGADIGARRALERVQHIIGADQVLVPEIQGGRTPSEQVHLTAWDRPETAPRSGDLPWPGRLAGPAPSLVYARPVPVELRSATGAPVRLVRGMLDLDPATVDAGEGTWGVTGWTGPWPVPPRWWHTGDSTWSALVQVLCTDGKVLLLVGAETWTWVGTYD